MKKVFLTLSFVLFFGMISFASSSSGEPGCSSDGKGLDCCAEGGLAGCGSCLSSSVILLLLALSSGSLGGFFMFNRNTHPVENSVLPYKIVSDLENLK